jgi:hypothetical protein
MSAEVVEELPHPLLDGVAALERALDGMPVDGWAGLEAGVLRSSAERLMQVEARVMAQLMAVTRALDATGAAQDAGASSTGALLAGSFGGDKRAGDAMVHRAKRLAGARGAEAALAKGEIGAAQADVIAGAIADLPAGTTDEQRQACEDTLIGDAAKYSLKDLKSRSKRVTDQFKPEPEVDEIENGDLETQEKAAWAKSEFWTRPNGDGTTTGGFRLPDAQADMLEAAIKAVSAPKRDHLRDHPGAAPHDGRAQSANETGDTGSSVYDRELEYRTRLGMGFAEVCSRLPGHLLPGRSGLGATLMVHLDLRTLVDGIKAATLSTGTRLSASQARLMACNLGIIPLVFNGKSLPVDHGHEQRLFTRSQKQDLSARDGGCTAPECDKPPEQTEGHHWRMQWAHGGTTTLDDGVLLCPFHHRRVHQDNWQARLAADGHIEWKRPGDTAWVRNHRWRP